MCQLGISACGRHRSAALVPETSLARCHSRSPSPEGWTPPDYMPTERNGGDRDPSSATALRVLRDHAPSLACKIPKPWFSYPRARESTPNDAAPGETSLQPDSHGGLSAILGNLALHTHVSISDPLLVQAVVLRRRKNRFVRFFFAGNEGARTGSEVHSFSCCHTPDLPCRKDDKGVET